MASQLWTFLVTIFAGILMMFAGIYMIDVTNEVLSTCQYTTGTNSSVINVTTNTSSNFYFPVTGYGSGYGVRTTCPATLNFLHQDVNNTVNDTLMVLVGTTGLQNYTVTAGVHNRTITGVTNDLSSGIVVFNLSSNLDNEKLNVSALSVRYATHYGMSTFQSTHEWLLIFVGTIFAIMGLIVTVVSLGMAFRSILGFGGKPS